MQKFEKKRVAGGASWKLLKIKVQICSVVARKQSRETVCGQTGNASARSGESGAESSRLMIIHILEILSSILRIFLVLGGFAHRASFERVLHKGKKTPE
jgi:hypothetical protein